LRFFDVELLLAKTGFYGYFTQHISTVSI